jgi:hypothetical protein
MLSNDVITEIKSLYNEGLSRLQIIQHVMSKYGSRFPNHTFNVWGKNINDAINSTIYQNDDTGLNVANSAMSKISGKDSPLNTAEQSIQTKVTPPIINNLYYNVFDTAGAYKLEFSDYIIPSVPAIEDVLKTFIIYVGVRQIKQLNLKVNGMDLISEESHTNQRYKLCSNCNLIIKLTQYQITDIIREICLKLQLDIVLYKGKTKVLEICRNSSTVDQNNIQKSILSNSVKKQ